MTLLVYKNYQEHLLQVRQRNRCKLTGRPRGYMRQFGISRNTFREMALDGYDSGDNKIKLVEFYQIEKNKSINV